MSNENPLLITHANCWDGYGCAAVWRIYKGAEAEVFYAAYQTAPPDVRGRDVVIADFSYDRATTEKMYAEARSLLILDHHDTSQRCLEGLSYFRHSPSLCGTQLIFAYFNRNSIVDYPEWIIAIASFDYWRVEHRLFRPWSMVSKSIPREKAVETLLLYHAHPEMFDNDMARGTTIAETVDNMVAVATRPSKLFLLNISDIDYPAVFDTGSIYNEVGHALAIREDNAAGIGIVCMLNDGDVTLSFRSRKEIDCIPLAQSLGGGGHPNASGAKVSWADFCKMRKAFA